MVEIVMCSKTNDGLTISLIWFFSFGVSPVLANLALTLTNFSLFEALGKVTRG